MINKKIKRFLVMLRNTWRAIFDTEKYEKEDTARITKNMVDYFMEVPVEYRLKMLKSLSSQVVERTESEIVELRNQMEHIEKQLFKYKT